MRQIRGVTNNELDSCEMALEIFDNVYFIREYDLLEFDIINVLWNCKFLNIKLSIM